MAGSINLSLSQQFDITNGRLLSGGKLYTFLAGTTTPQSAYRDQALTLAHTNPIILASDGRVPQMYFADGSVKARLTNRAGVVQFESDNILVVGPSSGGGGGSSVDPNTIFATGDVLWLDQSGTKSGWVRDNGKTIGSATSGSSERANSDCQALFEFLWNTYSDTVCPVSTGRGLTSSADWGANKTITLPDKRGYLPGGLSDMGNTDSGRLSGVPIISGSATTAGSRIGEATHLLSTSELPSHNHALTDPGHTHLMSSFGVVCNGGATINTAGGTQSMSTAVNTQSATTGITLANTGGGAVHNNVPLTVLGTFFRKL